MQLTSQEKTILKDLVSQLRSKLGAQDVLLYGSAARGRMSKWSDIDILVILPHVDWSIEKQVTDLCFAAELECNRIISAQCMTRHEMCNTPLKASPFVRNIEHEGVPL